MENSVEDKLKEFHEKHTTSHAKILVAEKNDIVTEKKNTDI